MITLNEGLVSMDIDGEYIVVEPETGRYLASNLVAHEMLEAIRDHSHEEDALSRLLGRFDVEPTTLSSDFQAFQARLLELGVAGNA